MSENDQKEKTDPPKWTHLLVESSSLEELKGPLRGSARLKFTCMSVSMRYIALGSNTGNVYIFDRSSLKHLQVIFPEVEPSPVNVVALCPNDKLVVFSTINGHVAVMEMNIDKRQKPDRLRIITEHLRTTVTCLHWETSGNKLFCADSSGKVSVASVPRMKNLVLPVDVIMRLESPVVQLDWADDKLLVSTMTRCYLCSTTRQQYSQVGKKPREGEYGGCFYKLNKSALPLIYCARPSSRIWEVDFEGTVLSTHQFKQLLAVPACRILSMKEDEFQIPISEAAPQGTNYSRMEMIGSQFLVAVNRNKIFIFNPVKVKVILWTKFSQDIQDMCIMNRDIYLFFVDAEVRKIQLFPVAQVISIIIKRKNLQLASDIFCKFEQVLIQAKWRKHLSISLLQEFCERLKDENKADIAQTIQQVLINIKSGKEADSDGESTESYRSRSSSTTSIRSYSSGLQQPVALETEKIYEQDTNLAAGVNADNLHQKPKQEGSQNVDDVDGGKPISPTSEESNTAEVMSPSQDNSTSITLDTTTTEGDEMINNKENNINIEVKQDDEDLAPVIAVENNVVQRQSSVKGKKKRIVNLAPTRTKQKSKGKLAIYDDDIFASDDKASSKEKTKKEKKKSKGSTIKAKPTDHNVESHPNDLQSSSSTQDNGTSELLHEQSSHDLISSNQNEKPIITDPEKTTIFEKSLPSGEYMINNDQTTNSESVAHGTQNGIHDVIEEESNSVEEPNQDNFSNRALKSSTSVTDLHTGVNKSVIHRAMSESDIFQTTTTTPNIDPEVFDSAGSSPSYSPLSQSWEGTVGDGMEQSSKITLTSVKDSLQSKFSLTKKRLLKTIKEKNILSRSPLLESTSPVSQSSSVSGKLISTVLEDNEIRTEPEQEEVEVIPPIDLTDLQLTTESTQMALQDLRVLLNPDLVQEILRKWVIQLNKNLQALHTKVYKTKLDEESGCVTDKKEPKEEVKFYQEELDTISQCSDADTDNEETPDVVTESEPSGIVKPERLTSDLTENITSKAEQIEVSFNDVIHSVDPFLMPPELHQSVSELAQTCYTTQIFGDITQYTQTVQMNDQENNSSSCDNKENSLPFNNKNDQKNYESSIELNDVQYSQRTKDCDLEFNEGQGHRLLTTAKCVFMKCHCHLLDMSQVKQEVYSCQGDVFEQWYSYVMCLQDISKHDMFCQKLSNNEIHYAEDILKIGDFASDRTLGYVSKLFEINQTKAIDFSIDSRHIKPLDVYLMCLCYNRPVSQHFLRYMSAKVNDVLTANRFQSPEVYGHSLVSVKWLELLLSLTSHKEPLADSDDCPVPQSHKAPWKYQEMIEHVLKSAQQTLWLQMLETCTLSKYWLGCLKMMKLLQRPKDMLTLILQLGDITLLDSGSPVGYLPVDNKEWKFLLKALMQKMKSRVTTSVTADADEVDACSNDQQHITVTEVCRLMICHLGANTTISVLEECGIPEIPSEALQCAVTATFLQTHQRNVAHNMLEKLDSYLWAKKPVALMPELRHFVSHEKLIKANHGVVPAHDTNFSHMPSSSLPCYKYREEVDLHWGVASKINRACACCHIVLTETVSHVEPGVLVFDCGHIFHKMCNPERQCLICLSQVPGLQFV